jgi:hypothetical protein
MNHLWDTLRGEPFLPVLYHYVLTYSKWESAMICKSESFDALSAGLQRHYLRLVTRPVYIRLTRWVVRFGTIVGATRAVPPSATGTDRSFRHGRPPHQPRRPHENGKIERRHYRCKRALENQLVLRGSRDFARREDNVRLLNKLIAQLTLPDNPNSIKTGPCRIHCPPSV